MGCGGQLGVAWIPGRLLQLIEEHQLGEKGGHHGHHGQGLMGEHGRGQGAGPVAVRGDGARPGERLGGGGGRVALVITVITEAPDGQVLRTAWVRVTVRFLLDFLLDFLICVAEDEIHSEIKSIVS